MQKRNLVYITIALSSLILLSGFLAGFYVHAVTTAPSTLTISSGIYPGAPSYTFWTESSVYYAKNANGETIESGTNATTVLNNLIGNCTDGEEIYIPYGSYTFDGTINAKIFTSLIGESWQKTIFISENNGSLIQIGNPAGDSSTIWGFNMRNIKLYTFYPTYNGDTVGLNFTGNVYYCNFENLWLEGFNVSINIQNYSSYHLANCHFLRIEAYNWLGAGFRITGAADSTFQFCVSGTGRTDAKRAIDFWSTGGGWCKWTSTHIWGKTGGANTETGVFLNGHGTLGTSDVQFIGLVGGDFVTGINLTASNAVRHQFIGVKLGDCTTYISDSGTYSQWGDCLLNSKPLISSGNEASCVNGSAIAHGLAGSPTSVTLSLRGQTSYNATVVLCAPTVLSLNSTHFLIELTYWETVGWTLLPVTAVEPQTVYWDARYEP